MLTLQSARAELRELLHSQEFAYAFGHGCSIPDHPNLRAVRQRHDELLAFIREHSHA